MSDPNTNADSDASLREAKSASYGVLLRYLDAYLRASTEVEKAEIKEYALESAYITASLVARISRGIIAKQLAGLISSRTRSVHPARPAARLEMREQTLGSPSSPSAAGPLVFDAPSNRGAFPSLEGERVEERPLQLPGSLSILDHPEPQSLGTEGASSKSLMEPIRMDYYRYALFDAMKEFTNYQGTLSDFLLECMDEWFQRRGISALSRQ